MLWGGSFEEEGYHDDDGETGQGAMFRVCVLTLSPLGFTSKPLLSSIWEAPPLTADHGFVATAVSSAWKPFLFFLFKKHYIYFLIEITEA